MRFVHCHSTGTERLFQQEAKMSGRIADELVVLIIHETTELEFLKHLTATSGRRPSRSASPGSSEAAARESARNRSLRASGPTVRNVSDFHTTTVCVRSGMGFIPRPHQVELPLERLVSVDPKPGTNLWNQQKSATTMKYAGCNWPVAASTVSTDR